MQLLSSRLEQSKYRILQEARMCQSFGNGWYRASRIPEPFKCIHIFRRDGWALEWTNRKWRILSRKEQNCDKNMVFLKLTISCEKKKFWWWRHIIRCRCPIFRAIHPNLHLVRPCMSGGASEIWWINKFLNRTFLWF